MSQQGGLKGMLHRLTASEEQLESEELQRESERAGCKRADSVRRGELVTVAGGLRTVVYTPRPTLPTLDAARYDGTDVSTLVFPGRRQIAGVEPGRAVLAKGRVADRDGRNVIYNPHYELEAAT